MDTKSFILGGVATMGVYGICKTIRWLTESVPLSAAEMAEKKFDPTESTCDHPFYKEWASVDRNKESLEALEERFRKGLKRMWLGGLKPDDIKKLSQQELTILMLSSLTETLESALKKYPESIMEEIGQDCEFDLEGDGSMIWDPGITLPKSTDPNFNSLKQRKASHDKNSRLMRRVIRTLSTEMIKGILYDSASAQTAIKLIKSSDYNLNVEDISVDELSSMFVAAYSSVPYQFRKEADRIAGKVLLVI